MVTAAAPQLVAQWTPPRRPAALLQPAGTRGAQRQPQGAQPGINRKGEPILLITLSAVHLYSSPSDLDKLPTAWHLITRQAPWLCAWFHGFTAAEHCPFTILAWDAQPSSQVMQSCVT